MAGSWWGYGKDNGPSRWHEQFAVAKEGSRQSPIEIKNAETKYDSSLKPLTPCYDASSAKSIANTGYSVQVDYDDCTERSVLTGGPLCGKYRLRQFHFHWGACDGHGSEHVVDGTNFAGELHLVHWNAEKYCEFGEAAKAPDGLAVIGVFLKICDANPALQKLVCAMDCIKTKNSRSDFTDFDPSTLLPPCQNYWTYLGSLTTPPLFESVTWIVLKDPITISSEQMAKFRTLQFSGPNDPMQDNYRPPQPLKCREIRRNFQ
ncbi:carbonic anhydrase 13-like [Heptranchias perlo]|uniref:carbonic anhydrase 13-like n=1 Tax=Heptranchias perlo TaxID=212740 RepID=UPI003559DFA7